MSQLNIQVHMHILVSILGFAFFFHLNLRLFQKCVAASILRPQKFLGARNIVVSKTEKNTLRGEDSDK